MAQVEAPTGEAHGLAEEIDFDPDELRERYRRERDVRLRPEGEAQYHESSGKFEHFATEDPWAPPPMPRDPITGEVEVTVIGGGFAGILAAARLREAGVDDVRIIEAGSDLGGTWYWNRYPGIQCDIESYIYMPLLEETGYMPTQKYARGEEIYEHAQRIGNKYGLYDLAVFQTRATQLRWDESIQRWVVETDRGDAIKARFVIHATGPISRVKLPGIPGIGEFEGHIFHASRWDYDYTGGDIHGNMTKLADKKVALIGTGATGIQLAPRLGESASELYVFQRTPASVDERNNRPTDHEWANSLEPGWQRRRRENFNDILGGQSFEEDLVADRWTDMFVSLKLMATAGFGPGQGTEDPSALAEIADFKKMNKIRARVASEVEDPEVAEKLKPWYRLFCKRPTFSDDYLQTFNRPNVHLVDVSRSRGVERITKSGLIVDGVEYPIDLIVLATGFEVGTALRRRFGIEILGEGGQSLFDHWGEGMRTLHGHSTHGFPNWFFMGIGQNGVTFNYTAMVDDQSRHIAHIIEQTRRRGATAVQPTIEAEDDWVRQTRGVNSANLEFFEACTPGYYNSEGKIAEATGSFFKEAYPLGLNAFNELLAGWRDRGDLDGLEFDAQEEVSS